MQILPVNGHKVLQTSMLFIDELGNTVTLCEILHTTRDFLGYEMVFLFIESHLSRLKKEDADGVGGAVASRSLLPAFTMTDKDTACLNAISLAFNHVK